MPLYRWAYKPSDKNKYVSNDVVEAIILILSQLADTLDNYFTNEKDT